MFDERLARAFDFDAADLAANQSGNVGKRQRKKLGSSVRWSGCATLVVPIVMFFATMIILEWEGGLSEDTHIKIAVGLTVVLGVLPTIFYFVMSLRSFMVAVGSGRVQALDVSPEAIRTDEHGLVVVQLGSAELVIAEPQARALKAHPRCRIYYIDDESILAAEPVSK